jgi:hypothetical protein
LYPCHPSLRVCDHLCEEICKAGPAELRIATPVEVPVVNGLTIGGHPETGRRLRYGLGLLLLLSHPEIAGIHAGTCACGENMGKFGGRRHS